MVFGQEFRNRTAQSTYSLMLFDGEDHAGFVCGFFQDIAIQRLDGVHVDDTSRDAHVFQHVRRFQRFPNLMAGSHQGHVGAVKHQLGFPDLEFLVFVGEIRHRLASETDIDRAFQLLDRLHGRNLGLGGVTRRDDCHVRQHPHGCNILQSLMGSAIRSYRDSSMGTTDDHVNVVIAGRNTDLIVGSMRRKHAVGAEHRYLAAQRHARRHRHSILFSDAHGEKAVGKRLLEEVHPH